MLVGYEIVIPSLVIYFNTISRTSESSKNDIGLLTCNNLFITYYMLKKNQATKLKYKKVAFKDLEAAISLIKLQSNSSRQIWRQASAKI